MGQSQDNCYFKESWVGNSRDGEVVEGDGWHYFRMERGSVIVEAFELYVTDEGEDVVTILPEMVGVDWLRDFGFSDLAELDAIDEDEFLQIKESHQQRDSGG